MARVSCSLSRASILFHSHGKQVLTFYETWQRACKQAGISAKRLVHDFRRTAVRNLARAGVPERGAMVITGHKTRGVSERCNIVSAGDLEEMDNLPDNDKPNDNRPSRPSAFRSKSLIFPLMGR
jgi:hypothetical protein